MLKFDEISGRTFFIESNYEIKKKNQFFYLTKMFCDNTILESIS